MQNLQNCSQNKRGSEFAELRTYSQNSFFHKHNPNICRICRLDHKQKRFRICRTQNLFSEFILHKQTQHLQNLQNCSQNKRGSEFCRTKNFSEFNSSQTKPKFAELLRKKGSEFAQLRIYSENQLLRNKPKICRICRTVLCVCVLSCLLLQCRRFFFFFFSSSSSSVGVQVCAIINSEKVGRERKD